VRAREQYWLRDGAWRLRRDVTQSRLVLDSAQSHSALDADVARHEPRELMVGRVELPAAGKLAMLRAGLLRTKLKVVAEAPAPKRCDFVQRYVREALNLAPRPGEWRVSNELGAHDDRLLLGRTEAYAND
jgi:hypothetical protein